MTLTEQAPFIRLHGNDNVAVARAQVSVGATVAPGVTAQEEIPAGHKVALTDIAKGQAILKYSVTIGEAGEDIAAGRHVHRHNVVLVDRGRDYAFCSEARPTEVLPEAEQARFQGILRADGAVATRNFIGVLASVNCSASVCRFIADAFRGEALADFPQVDGVVALTHTTGCGMDTQTGLSVLRRTLAGYARHPNFAGLLIVGLGCERNQVAGLLESQGLNRSAALQTLVIQEDGGTRSTVERGVAAIHEMLPEANRVTRQPVSARHLKIGLQCGGSDGYSALTANPALGAAMDRLVRHGGTAILSETPEIYGVEHLLTRRAATPEVGQKLVDLLDWWKAYTKGESNQMTNNPPPGNTAGGLATIFEKSLGSAMKGGTTALQGVYGYAEPIERPGFVFMDAPGFDPVAATGQVASGANLICFTTGRGSVFGCKPVPSLKLATNSDLYRRMTEDMDINCGAILDGEASIESMGETIFQALLETASGKATKSELLGMGDAEFVPWQLGATS
ncbi:MAG: altronate dehydratase family protein [Rhodospirillales bacterium]